MDAFGHKKKKWGLIMEWRSHDINKKEKWGNFPQGGKKNRIKKTAMAKGFIVC